MNRRSFLMKLGAGLVGALVVRPVINYTWDTARIDFFTTNALYGGTAGGGKTELMYWQMKMLCDYPRSVGFIDNIQIPEGY